MPALKNSLGLRAALLSLLIFAGIVVLWQIATQPTAGTGPAVDPEYAKLVGADPQMEGWPVQYGWWLKRRDRQRAGATPR